MPSMNDPLAELRTPQRWNHWLGGLLVLHALLGFSCTSPASQASMRVSGASDSGEQDSTAPYDFSDPAIVHALPDDLEEISGLTLLDADRLGAVQDEEGDVYIIDWRTGDILAHPDFGKDDDYEAIERVDDRLYVLRSDGTLFILTNWEDDPDTDRVDTGLKQRNDTEGLAYDSVRNQLLILCKEDPGKGLGKVRAVYAFDLETHELGDEPLFTIPLSAFEPDGEDFKPSALAVHPITGDVYLLSSVRQLVVVLDPAGTLKAAWQLPADLLPQPEGLAFRPNGDMFVASEGDGGTGILVLFTYHTP
jgi:uncharacterized protein YjiK